MMHISVTVSTMRYNKHFLVMDQNKIELVFRATTEPVVEILTESIFKATVVEFMVRPDFPSCRKEIRRCL